MNKVPEVGKCKARPMEIVEKDTQFDRSVREGHDLMGVRLGCENKLPGFRSRLSHYLCDLEQVS